MKIRKEGGKSKSKTLTNISFEGSKEKYINSNKWLQEISYEWEIFWPQNQSPLILPGNDNCQNYQPKKWINVSYKKIFLMRVSTQ